MAQNWLTADAVKVGQLIDLHGGALISVERIRLDEEYGTVTFWCDTTKRGITVGRHEVVRLVNG